MKRFLLVAIGLVAMGVADVEGDLAAELDRLDEALAELH